MVLKSKEKVFFGHPIKILPYSEHYNTKDDSDGDEGPTEGNSRWGNGLERKYSYTEEPTLQSPTLSTLLKTFSDPSLFMN